MMIQENVPICRINKYSDTEKDMCTWEVQII